ncbi:hypothetical protein [Chitinophaga agri]|uniref:Uncharacterized protein n=1 Tax=Chitinophaga agri TaxID=2703787 RepID=A0A6B9ZDN4_9BACT|nr:hypothetical protein [Chitinophaga agri]QHS59255.1 hypothetical protein GWR21_06555 [Chitinophaga agri]
MAIVKDNLLLQFVSGTIGKQVTIYERKGQIIMAKKRRPSARKPTKKQLKARDKMKTAGIRASVLLEDPELKAYYATLAGPGQHAHNIAVKDVYDSPEIQQISVERKEIIVMAKNHFRVAEVHVQVIDADGVILEHGPAVLGRNGIEWHYKAGKLPADSRIIATAIDLPGNETTIERVVN